MDKDKLESLQSYDWLFEPIKKMCKTCGQTIYSHEKYCADCFYDMEKEDEVL